MVRKRTFEASKAVIPAVWREIVAQPKTLGLWPIWSEPPELPPARVLGTRDDVLTVAAETIEIHAPLAGADGVGLEGVFLRMVAWPYRREYDITATLEVPGGRNYVALSRVDGWPADPHRNVRARGRPGCGHIPPEVIGHHVHRFEDNAIIGREAFGAGQDGNLPLAVPVNGRLESFRDFLRVVGKEFNIDGLDQVDPPNWTVMI